MSERPASPPTGLRALAPRPLNKDSGLLMLNAVKKQIKLTCDLPAPSRYECLVCCLNMLLSTMEENEAGIALLYQHVLENQSFQDVVLSDVFEAQWELAKEVLK